jgi:hypothetical protein
MQTKHTLQKEVTAPHTTASVNLTISRSREPGFNGNAIAFSSHHRDA